MLLHRQDALPEVSSSDPVMGEFISVWGRQVHFLSAGRGKPILLLHGNGSLGQEILSCFPMLSGVRWIAPDRPGYGLSHPSEAGRQGPAVTAEWIAAFMDALGIHSADIVAHSLAAGAALHLAARHPERVNKLVLLAPFCRPTPHRWMLGLRLAVAPIIGPLVRKHVIPVLASVFRLQILRGMLFPNAVPRWLRRFPLLHAVRDQSIKTTAAELRCFNNDMAGPPSRLRVSVTTTALFGCEDETAPWASHEPWLRKRVEGLTVIKLPDTGHAVHHAAPGTVLKAILG